MDEYGQVQLAADAGAALTLACPKCDDPVRSLRNLPQYGEPHTIEITDGIFAGPRVHRYLQYSYAYANTPDNHFQGVQRVGDYLLVTASDWTEPAAHLFIIKLTPSLDGNARGQLERVVALSKDTPHPGGFQCYGDVAPIPLEGEGKQRSRVIFLNVANPAQPCFIADMQQNPLVIERENKKASATGLIRLPDDRLLLGVYWGGDNIDFYLSRSENLREGFLGLKTRQVQKIDRKKPDYQSIIFAKCDALDGGGARIWLIGLRSAGKASNYAPGANIADVLTFDLPADLLANWPAGDIAQPAYIDGDMFSFDRDCGNFAAAASLATEDDGSFTLYALNHWRDGRKIRFSICRANPII